MNAIDESEEAGSKLEPAKIPVELMRRLRVIKAHRGGTIADLINTYAGARVEREYRKVLDEMQAVIGAEG